VVTFENVAVACAISSSTAAGGECSSLIDLDGIMDSVNDIYFPDTNWKNSGCDTLTEEQWTNYAIFWKVPNEDPCYIPLIRSASESISQDVKNYVKEETFIGSICGAVCSWTSCDQVETLTQLATSQQEEMGEMQEQVNTAVEENQTCISLYTPCVEESLQCSVDLVDCQNALATASATQEGKSVDSSGQNSLPYDQYNEIQADTVAMGARLYAMEHEIFDLKTQVQRFQKIENINVGCEILGAKLDSEIKHWEKAVKEAGLACSFVPKTYCSKITACKNQSCADL